MMPYMPLVATCLMAQQPILTTYIGTKIIQAMPQQHADGRDGYQVVYEDGYTSWSPADVFERAYRKTDAMTFGDAIVMLEADHRVARSGWNGKGMWLGLIDGKSVSCALFHANDRGAALFSGLGFAPWVGMKTASGDFVPWLPSQTDMLAKDWRVVE